MLNKEDALNLLKLIDRVDIKGNEATAVAIIQQKLATIANATGETLPAPTEEPSQKKK